MNYSKMLLHDDPEMVKSDDTFPSFCARCVILLAKDELFLEETILVSRPGGSSRDLQAQRLHRCHSDGNFGMMRELPFLWMV